MRLEQTSTDPLTSYAVRCSGCGTRGLTPRDVGGALRMATEAVYVMLTDDQQSAGGC
jgi:hypothetical protein